MKSLTPREWIDWLLEQYGLTVDQMAAGAAAGMHSVAAPALTLMANVLTERFGPSLTAEVLSARRTDGLAFTRHQIHHRLDPEVRAKHEVSDQAIAYHLGLLVDPPHVTGDEEPAEATAEALPAGWAENDLTSNGRGHVMASAYAPDNERGITVWAWDEESALAGLYAAAHAAEGTR